MRNDSSASGEIPSEGPEDAGDGRAGGEPRIEPFALERAMNPLRRWIAYAVRNPGEVRYLEVNAARLLERALHLPVPDPVREGLATIRGRLVGIDGVAREERLRALSDVAAHIARIDAVLGLPEVRLRFRRPRRRVSPRRQAPEPEVPVVEEAGVPVASADVGAPGGAGQEPEGAASTAAPASSEAAAPAAAAAPATPAPAADPAPSPAPRRDRPKGPFRLGEGPLGAPLTERGLPASWVAHAAEVGVGTHTDLLERPPDDTEILRPVHGAGRPLPAGRVAVGGRVRVRLTRLTPGGPRRTEAWIRGAGPLWVAWPDRLPEPEWAALTPGSRVILVGTVRDGPGPRVEDVEIASDAGNRAAGLAGYGAGEADRALRAIHRRLRDDCAVVRDPLPSSILTRHGLPGLGDALAAVHGATADRRDGRRRLAFDEALIGQIGLTVTAGGITAARGIPHAVLHGFASRLTSWRDVALTDDVARVLEDVKRDLRRPHPMRRVIVGRPGDDRDLVLLLAAVLVAETRAQVAWLLPDAATAEAVFTFVEPLLRELGFVCRLLPPDPTRPQRDAVRRGEVHVVFGSHDLVAAGLEFRRLGLVLAREREPGALAADALVPKKGPAPDRLVMPDFSVGAGHLLGAYAGYDVSRVARDRWPKFRCQVVPESARATAYARVAERLAAGGDQVLVALPVGASGDLLTPDEAVSARAWIARQLPEGTVVQIFHGDLSREERYRRYDDFRRARFPVLLATHAAEVGPPCPGASCLVVEQADRFPKARLGRLLHRLRGTRDPEVLLIHGEPPDPEGLAVLHAIARGRVDDALATEVPIPEIPRLAWIDPARDVDLLLAARDEARRLLVGDPHLRHGPGPEIARRVVALWPRLFDGPCPITAPPPGQGRRRRRRRRRR